MNKIKKRWWFAVVMTLSWCGVSDYVTQHYFNDRMTTLVAQQRAVTEARAIDLSESLRRNVHFLDGIPGMLAHLIRVDAATAGFGPDVLPSTLPLAQRKQRWTEDDKFNDLSRYFRVVQSNLGTDLIFLTNAAGDAIAASNWDAEGSPIGTNYADRDWYAANKQGKPGFQYAMGRTTHVAGLYFATPVIKHGRYVGSVVVKVKLPNLSFLLAQTDAYLTDQYGVIILAQDPSLVMQTVPDASVYTLSEGARLSRYDRGEFVKRSLTRWQGSSVLGLYQRTPDDTPRLSVVHALDEYDLTVHVEHGLAEFSGLQRERWLWFLLMAGLGSALIVGLTSLWSYLATMRKVSTELRESETRYRTLAEWMPESVIVHRDGKLIYVNQAAVELYGARSAQDLMDWPLHVLIHPDSMAIAQARIRQNASDGLPTPPLELRSVRLDGTVFDVEVRGIRIQFDGEPAAFALLRDVSERKQSRMLIEGQKRILELIATGAPLGGVLESLMRLIEAQVPEVLGCIQLLDEPGLHLHHGVAPGLPDEFNRALDGLPIGPNAGSCGTAAYRKEPVYVADIATDPLWSDYKLLALPQGLRACWSTPIFDGQQRVIATFAMYLRHTGLPQAEHLRLIQTVTHIAAIAISRSRAEHILRKSEGAFRALFESSRDALMTSTREDGFTDGNAAALALFGFADKESFTRCTPADMSPELQPDGRRSDEKALEMMGIALEQGAHFFEWVHKRANGTEFFADVLLTRIQIEGKTLLHATVRDISERKRLAMLEQQRLDELELLYRFGNTTSNALLLEDICETAMDYTHSLLNADRVAILLSNASGAMCFKAWRGLSDTYRQQVDGISPWAAHDQDPQPIFLEDIEVDIKAGRTLANLRQEGIRSLACLPLFQHGQLLGKLMLCFDQPHRYTQHERHLATTLSSHLAFAIDRKHAEQQFADIFEFAPDALVLTDMQAVITLVNHQAETMFGYTKQELIGQPIDILIPKTQNEERRNFRQRFLNSAMRPRPLGGMSRKDLRGIGKDGRVFPVELSLRPMQSQHGVMIAAAIRDISARQQVMDQLLMTARELEVANALVEEERAQLTTRVEERTSQLRIANRAKDSFLATMSHEIRTPLGGLLGMMELLSLTPLDAEQLETLQAARNSGKGLLRIVDDILDWSKIEAGKLRLAPRPALILPMLKSVVATYGQLASAKGLQLRYRYDESISQAHLFDPLRLSQILNNFTSNAIKFTSTGTVEISAALSSQHEGCDEVRFCVKDTGLGIDKEQLARLFQHYEQASPDTARMYGGTGLGLAICRSLAELMEGHISVESTLGVGSCFCFTARLPIANSATQRDMQLQIARGSDAEAHELDDTLPWHNPEVPVSILVVDDHPVNRMLLKQQLEQLGLHADIAAYGIVALALWQTGHYDVVITDCHMPEMDGYELTRCIRDIEAQDSRARTPIVAWTANVMSEEEGRCKAAGMDDLLTKPTELADLQVMLRKWLLRPEQIQQVDQLVSPPEVTAGDAAANLADGTVLTLELGALQKIAKTRSQQIAMLQEFTLHNRNDIAVLAAALQSGNPSAVSRGAHRIKGASRMVGAMQLAALCASIEQAASYGDMNSARTLAKGLYQAKSNLEHDVARFIDAQ